MKNDLKIKELKKEIKNYDKMFKVGCSSVRDMRQYTLLVEKLTKKESER